MQDLKTSSFTVSRVTLCVRCLPLCLGLFLVLTFAGCASIPSAEISRAKAEGIPILIGRMQASLPNSAGGVSVTTDWVNTSQNTLKYVTFEVEPYNRVGDLAPSEIGRKTKARLKETGPFKPGSGSKTGSRWANVWYNHGIKCLKITGVELIYIDGTVESFKNSSVSALLPTGYINSCDFE